MTPKRYRERPGMRNRLGRWLFCRRELHDYGYETQVDWYPCLRGCGAGIDALRPVWDRQAWTVAHFRDTPE